MKAKVLLVSLSVTLSGLLLFGITEAVAKEPRKDRRVDKHTVLLLTFDEGEEAVAKDSSDEGNDGTIKGAKWVEGKYGSALEFNGTNSDYVVMPRLPSLDDIVKDFTLEAWVKFPKVQKRAQVVCNQQGAGFSLELRNGLVSAFPYIGDDYVLLSGNTELRPDEWYYVATTYDGNTIKVYVNEKLDGEKEIEGTVKKSTAPVMVGANPNFNGTVAEGQYFAGVIDEVRISNVVRTPAKIKAAMKGAMVVRPLSKLTTTWARVKNQY